MGMNINGLPPVKLPKIENIPLPEGEIPVDSIPEGEVADGGVVGSIPFVDAPTEEQKAELSNLVDTLAANNQMNIVTVEDNTLPEGLPEGVTTHSVNGNEVTLYNVDGVVKAQAVGNGEVNFPDIYNQIASAANSAEGIDGDDSAPVATNGVNGEFDEQIKQGGTGDCWLISGLLALNSTPEGKQIIKDSITVNDDGSVTVDFKGVGASYTISPEELQKYDTDNISNDAFSNGDNDMLVFELAVSKLKSDIAAGAINIGVSSSSYEGYSDASIEGGFAQQVIYFMTGRTAQTYGVQSSSKADIAAGLENSTIYSVLQDAAENPPTVLTCAMYYGTKTATCVDGRTFNVDLRDYGHAFAITGVDAENQTVTIVNPWDSNKPYTMSWSEFANMGIGMISSTNLEGKGNYVAPSAQYGGAKRENNGYNNGYTKKYNYGNYSGGGGYGGGSYGGGGIGGGSVVGDTTPRRVEIRSGADDLKNIFSNDSDKSINTEKIKDDLADYLKQKLDSLGIKYDSSKIDTILDSCVTSNLDKYREIYAEAEIASALEREIDNAVQIADTKVQRSEDDQDGDYDKKVMDEIAKFLNDNIF